MGRGWDEATVLLPGYTILLIIRQYLIVNTVIKLIQEKFVLLFIAHKYWIASRARVGKPSHTCNYYTILPSIACQQVRLTGITLGNPQNYFNKKTSITMKKKTMLSTLTNSF